LFGEMGFPDQVENTSASGSVFFARSFHSVTNLTVACDNGTRRSPALVFGVPNAPSYTASSTVRCPSSRLTFFHRNANSSPRLKPVISARPTIVRASGGSAFTLGPRVRANRALR
jgi:hypothetical protein